ncbi:MAG: cytochrome c maturation protein CcmE [Oligoflexales bacterium]
MAKNKQPLKWLLVVGVIAVAGLAISKLNFGDNLVYFYTPQEAVAKAAELSAKKIRVGAMVKPGTVQWDPQSLQLAFTATDLKGSEIAVSHRGIKPDLFKEGQGVVMEGRIEASGTKFTSTNLMVKHSEEYKKPDDHGSMDKALLEESLFKGQTAN